MDSTTAYPIVIVGTGFAGYTVAREIRRRDRNVGVLMLSRDDGNHYSKPMLSNAFAEQMSVEQLAGTPKDQMAKRLNVVIQSNTGVDRIDAAAYCVHLSDGSRVRYEKLVLAVGARARLPRFGGNAADEILSVNSLSDYRVLRAALEEASSVAVIGAGLVGCELANDLLAGGYRVDLLDVSPRVLDRLLPPDVADIVTQALITAGVRWHPKSDVRAIDATGKDGHRFRISGSNGLSVSCDVVITAIGLEPQTVRCDPPIDTARGIVIDRCLRTSVKDIYAIGDCAELDGQLRPYLLPIQHGARALAATLTGTETAANYPAMPVDVKTPAHRVRVLLPSAGVDGAWRVEASRAAGTYAAFLGECGAIAGYVLSGDLLDREDRLLEMLAAGTDVRR